jgi:vacuolar protein sorting-associated protein 72
MMSQAEEDESRALVAQEDESDAEGSEEEEDDDDAVPVESLVAGRERRKTAGARYDQLITASLREDADDEIALLFAEEEGEDEEFDEDQVLAIETHDVEDDDSSSDEDDKAGGEDDELAGEKQLEKEARAAKRSQKKKAEQALAKAPPSRKRVRIAETAHASGDGSETPSAMKAPDKKRKRSTGSFLQQETDGPVRTSSRTLTVQNKERTIESIREAEERRAKALKNFEKSQRRKEATKKKPLTQAEKLAEAAKVERINSKSLNKWEEAENERMARQKARLDALHNRTLEGPVIRWYSGPAEWIDGRLIYVGRRPRVEEVPAHNAMPLRDPMQMYSDSASHPATTTATSYRLSSLPQRNGNEPALLNKHIIPGEPLQVMPEAARSVVPPIDPEGMADIIMEMSQPTSLDTGEIAADAVSLDEINRPEKANHGGFLDGLEYYAALDEEKQTPIEQSMVDVGSTGTVQNSYATNVQTIDLTQPQAEDQIIEPAMRQQRDLNEPPSAVSPSNHAPSLQYQAPVVEKQYPPWTGTPEEAERFERECPNLVFWKPKPAISTAQASSKQSAAPLGPGTIETSSRNILTLINFDENTIGSKDIMRRILFNWPAAHILPNTVSSNVQSYSSLSTASSTGLAASSTTAGPGRKKTTEVSAYIAVPPITPTCIITGKEARYLDPLTGLPYRGMQEFKALRRMAQADSNTAGTPKPVWSSLLNAYVGAGGSTPANGIQDTLETIRWRPARGVSEAFVGRKALLQLPAPAAASDIPAPAGTAPGRPAPPRSATEAPSVTMSETLPVKTEAAPSSAA